MQSSALPLIESLQFGSHLLACGLIRYDQLSDALAMQKERPFLHLGEVLCLMGILDEISLHEVLKAHHREVRLGGLLVEKGEVTIRELTEALALQASFQLPLGEILVRLGYLDREELARCLAEQEGQPYPPSRDLFEKCRHLQVFRQAQRSGTYPYFQPLQAAECPRTVIRAREVVLLASNSYLGLSTDPDAVAASIAATERYGTGTSGSPLLNGTMDLHVQLEAKLATFLGKEACALFSTGFQANLGVISCLVGRDDVVIVDSLAHASIHDGSRLSFGTFKRFNHNNLSHLEQQLRQAGNRAKLVVIDGVYSMDGDMADLPGIVRLARAYGAKVLLDDAHGFGVLGRRGRGTAEYFGLLDQVDLVMLTFSKALGTIGGCVLGDDTVIHYLKHRARSLVFSASLPPGTVAATDAALQRIMSDPSLRQRLENNVTFMRQGLLALGVDLSISQTHIIPVHIGDEQLALRMGAELLEEGVLVATVISPGVPPGQARLRVSVMASHTLADLQAALDAFERVGTRLGVVKRREKRRSHVAV